MPGRRVHPTIVAVVAASHVLWTPVASANAPAEAPASQVSPSAGDGADPEPAAPASPELEPPTRAPADADETADETPEETTDETTGETTEETGPTLSGVESAPAPTGGGVAGSVVSADDPAAKQAQADLEGESLDRNAAGVPARMPPLRVAAWWTMFGTVALGTVGGIFSGLAERQEDEAERLALGFDLETGARYPYEDYADEYERILDRGNTYQWASRGFLIGAGVTLAASIALFAVQAKRDKRERPVALRAVSPFAVEVGF